MTWGPQGPRLFIALRSMHPRAHALLHAHAAPFRKRSPSPTATAARRPRLPKAVLHPDVASVAGNSGRLHLRLRDRQRPASAAIVTARSFLGGCALDGDQPSFAAAEVAGRRCPRRTTTPSTVPGDRAPVGLPPGGPLSGAPTSRPRSSPASRRSRGARRDALVLPLQRGPEPQDRGPPAAHGGGRHHPAPGRDLCLRLRPHRADHHGRDRRARRCTSPRGRRSCAWSSRAKASIDPDARRPTTRSTRPARPYAPILASAGPLRSRTSRTRSRTRLIETTVDMDCAGWELGQDEVNGVPGALRFYAEGAVRPGGGHLLHDRPR